MSIRRFVAAALLGLGAAFTGTAVQADHSWNNYHWARTANPFTLKVVNSTTAEWATAFNGSLNGWSVDPINLTVAATQNDSKTRKRCGMVRGQMRVCNATYGFNGWLGLATIGLDSQGHIDRGTAKLNDSYASYWTIAGERNHVMCQEIGHVFGLGHTSEDGSSQQTCMDYSGDINSQWPNAHDYEMLAAIYAHLDSYNTYDDGGASDSGDGGGGGCNAPPGKGCNAVSGAVPMGVRVHRHGNHEIWVAPRPDGGLWIHHVRLAPDTE